MTCSHCAATTTTELTKRTQLGYRTFRCSCAAYLRHPPAHSCVIIHPAVVPTSFILRVFCADERSSHYRYAAPLVEHILR